MILQDLFDLDGIVLEQPLFICWLIYSLIGSANVILPNKKHFYVFCVFAFATTLLDWQ
jgi:hypothetical protein